MTRVRARRPSLATALARIEARRVGIEKRADQARRRVDSFLGRGGARVAGFAEDIELYDRLLRGRPHLQALLGPFAGLARAASSRLQRGSASERVTLLAAVVAELGGLEDEIARDAAAIHRELGEIERSDLWRACLYGSYEELLDRVVAPDPSLALLLSAIPREEPCAKREPPGWHSSSGPISGPASDPGPASQPESERWSPTPPFDGGAEGFSESASGPMFEPELSPVDSTVPAFLALSREAAEPEVELDEARPGSEDAMVLVSPGPLVVRTGLPPVLKLQLAVTFAALAIGAALGWSSTTGWPDSVQLDR